MIGFRARKELIDPAATTTDTDGGVFQGAVPQSYISLGWTTSKRLLGNGLRRAA